MALKYRSVRGMNDLFEATLCHWRKLEMAARKMSLVYGYGEIRTPVVESLELFKRGVGDTTDIVEKEMYVLPDSKGKELCLRPENTASVVRAMLQAGKLSGESEERVYYIGPMFRRERPQKGRLRQFHQLGIECFGLSSAKADVEIMAYAQQFLHELGIADTKLVINSLGRVEDRHAYEVALKSYLQSHVTSLCDDCTRRLSKNPLRILDCKNPNCQSLLDDAPATVDHLSDRAIKHYDEVKGGLSKFGIVFEESSKLVRGLDYYTDTVFEFMTDAGLGAQNTLIAGGRYDNLVKNLGGPDVPAVGFAAGIERLIMTQESNGLQEVQEKPALVVIGADDAGKDFAGPFVQKLRQKLIFADTDLKGRSVKAQFRRADKLNARFALALGSLEVDSKKAKLKELQTGTERDVDLTVEAIAAFL